MFSVTLETAGSVTVTVTDTEASSITGTSDSITVDPGPLDHFTVSNPVRRLPAIHSTSPSGRLRRVRQCGQRLDSTGQLRRLLWPLQQPSAQRDVADLSGGGACSGSPDYSELSFDPSGHATANITLYRASNAQTVPSDQNLTVTDTGPPENETGSSGSFTVAPVTSIASIGPMSRV